jgi:hypothetical protein
MSSIKTLAVLPVAIAMLVALSACAGEEPPELTTPDASTPTATPTPTPTAAALDFTEPEDCTTLLPQSRLDLFASRGLVLLGGPGGKYGTDYLADATPEEQAGGISCIWSFADSEISSLTISVAPLSASTRPAIVASFNEQGLNEATVDDAVTFAVQGDKNLNPAVYNVLRGESWISVIATIGGTDSYNEAVEVAAEVHDLVYAPAG